MSGPKPMTYSVDARQSGRALADQLGSLTRQLGQATGAAAQALQSQIEAVERLLEERRQRQEEEREMVRAQLYESWCATRDAIVSARVARQEMRDTHPGLEMPETLPLPPEPSSLCELEEIRAALNAIRQLQADETADFERVLKCYLERSASEKDVFRWFSTFKASGARTVGDVLATIEEVSGLSLEVVREDRLKRYADLARHQIEGQLRSAEGRGVQLPEAVLDGLDAVFNASDDQSAADAFQRLKKTIQIVSKQWDESERSLRAKEAAQKQKARETDMRTVAQALSYTLDSLGYATSGISDSAFSQQGELFAVDQQWPEHAVRFSFDSNSGGVVAAAVRIVESMASQSGTSATRMKDEEFDRHWCSVGCLGKVREELERRGIDARFQRKHEAGSVSLEVIESTESLESLRGVSGSRAGEKLRERKHE